MPDLVTHYYFAKEIQEENHLPIEHQDVFQLGAQGPDFLFYLNFLPWKGGAKDFTLGNTLHVEKTEQLIRRFQKLLKGENSILRSYSYGFLAHYILDSTAHPFVYYYTDNMADHKILESSIDIMLHSLKSPKHIHQLDTLSLIDVGEDLPREIVSLYQVIAKELYHEAANSVDINQSYRDFKSYLKWTRANNPIKISFINFLSSKASEPFAYHVYPREVDPKVLDQDKFKEFLNLYRRAKLNYKEMLRKKEYPIERDFNGDLF